MDMERLLTKSAKSINSSSSIPTRLFRKDEQIASFAAVPFSPDPITPHIQTILGGHNQVDIYATKDLTLYGTIRQDDYSIIIGPVGRITLDDAVLTEILFELGEPRERLDELRLYYGSIPPDIEATKFAQILCDINSCISDNDISILDIDIFDFHSDGNAKNVFELMQQSIEEMQDADANDESEKNEQWKTSSIQDSHKFEKNLLFAISHGQLDKLSDSGFFAQSVTVGQLANDNLRQMKNSHICLAVLASRAAIDGGMSVEQSYTLCNIYIQRIEKSKSFSELSNLSRQIIFDYATRVHDLLVGESHSPVVTRAISYIERNINQRLFVEDIADKLKVNRSYFSTKFKEETGMTLTDYIMQQKIFEAQRLIRYSDRSLLQISVYLDFSSQSYFQTQFKKYTGMTPKQYKEKSDSD